MSWNSHWTPSSVSGRPQTRVDTPSATQTGRLLPAATEKCQNAANSFFSMRHICQSIVQQTTTLLVQVHLLLLLHLLPLLRGWRLKDRAGTVLRLRKHTSEGAVTAHSAEFLCRSCCKAALYANHRRITEFRTRDLVARAGRR